MTHLKSTSARLSELSRPFSLHLDLSAPVLDVQAGVVEIDDLEVMSDVISLAARRP